MQELNLGTHEKQAVLRTIKLVKGFYFMEISIGKFTLESLTTGMYNEPESCFREYIQNAVDAIDMAIEEKLLTVEESRIEIIIDDERKVISVKDNGIGIDKKYHNKIFTKFVHLNNLYTKGQSSTGLGLTITKELVKLHKGKITLESAPNKGTTFKVQLKGALA